MKKIIIVLFLVIPVLSGFISFRYSDVFTSNYNAPLHNYNGQYDSLKGLGFNDSLVNAGLSKAQSSGYINSIVLIRNSKIAVERYFRNTDANTAFDVKSVTKSVISALVGNAIKGNYITLDTKLIDALPEYNNILTDERIKKITVRHLLTMTSGLKKDDYLYSFYNVNKDWVSTILSCQLDNEPGTEYRYSDAGAHLLSVIITKKTNQNTFNFAGSTIFNYLNIELLKWSADPQGIPFGGSGLYLTTREMAVLGVLYLNNGFYAGMPLVPKEWIKASTTDYTGWLNQARGKITNVGYGYLWWFGKMQGHEVYSATGYAGQFIFCIPDLNIVVATSAPSDVDGRQAGIQSNKLIEIVNDYFIPAAL
jgi:CubicO group peptidase (beta-lactamase class C family)